MRHLVHLVVLAAAAVAAPGIAALSPAPAPGDSVLEITLGGGPHAGTFKPPASETSCMHFKQQKQLTVVYKDFDANDPKKIGEAGINITNPDEAGPKRGAVLVAFGKRDDPKASRYSVSAPSGSAGSITLTRNGKTADLTFQGLTQDGIPLRVTAKCLEVEEL